MGELGRGPNWRRGMAELAAAFLWAVMAVACNAGALEVVADRSLLDPSRQESVTFAYQLPFAGKLSFWLCDSSHAVARTLIASDLRERGGYAVSWDGRLADGSLAQPGTAYYPLLELEVSGAPPEQCDAGLTGGAVVALPEAAHAYDVRAMTFKLSLPVAARVLLRAGVRSGPILKTLSSWSAFPAGVTTLAWDGWDDAHLVNVAARSDFIVDVQAIALPSPCVVIQGAAVKAVKRGAAKTVSASRLAALGKALMSKSVPVSPAYLQLPAVETPPSFQVAVEPAAPGASAQFVDVTPAAEDAARLSSERYEVAACVDLVRVSEEEQGRLPARMAVPLRGLAPGKHLLSISVVTVSGRHSTVTTEIVVGEH